MPTTTVKVKLTITLPEPLHDKLAERALKRGSTVEKEIVDRLIQCQDHTSSQPLYFNDDQRARLAHALGHVLTDPEDVLAKLARICDLEVGGISVPLEPRLQLRLKTRIPRGKTAEQFIRKEVTEGLERTVGMRPY